MNNANALTQADLVAAALADVPGLDIERSVPVAQLCTYRVGGPVSVLARVSTAAALEVLVAATVEHSVPTLTIGKGSNLLVADAGFDGVGIVLDGEFVEASIDGTTVIAGAAASLPVVARATVNAGLTGFEWAVGVPGTIGGAVRMNAGGHGSDMAASLIDVTLVDLATGATSTVAVGELGLAYRSSLVESHQLVTTATLELEAASTNDGPDTLKEIVRWRREHQPGGANAGSVFTNPTDDSAGRLIDAAGLKGLRIGSAEVSPKHANFIQADPDGSADDVMRLMVEIVDRIESEEGVYLHAETRLVGFADELVMRVQGAGKREGEAHG